MRPPAASRYPSTVIVLTISVRPRTASVESDAWRTWAVSQCQPVNMVLLSRCPAPRNKVSGLYYPCVLHGFGAATPVKNKYPFFLCFQRSAPRPLDATSTNCFSSELHSHLSLCPSPLPLPPSLAVIDVSLWQIRLSILNVKLGCPYRPRLISFKFPVFPCKPVGD